MDSLGDRPAPTTILKLPYLNAVCKETLRIYPVTMFTLPRMVKLPLEIGDYQFEPGTILSACIYLTHQREDLYPEPKQFKPERFLERQFSPYEYLAQIMGHDSLDTTMVYVRGTSEDLQRDVEKIAWQ